MEYNHPVPEVEGRYNLVVAMLVYHSCCMFVVFFFQIW